MVKVQMKLNREYIGKTYKSGPLVVDPESIQKYASATNETNPLYFPTNDNEELISPPLYPVVFIPTILSQLVDDAERIGLDRLRLVHSQHKVTWKDLLRPGDQINLSATIVNMEQHGIHDAMDLEIIYLRMDEPVIEMLYQILIRGKQYTGNKRTKKRLHVIETGMKLGEQSITISEDQGVRYAEASGDHNPIHINEEIAKLAGFPKTIVHGLCTMALTSKTIVDELLEGNPSRLKYMSTRFSKPVLMGQTITTELYDKGLNTGRHSIHFITRNEDGIPVLTNGVAEYID
jgi:acyl dehydratase